MGKSGQLSGLRVLVPRPSPQGEKLAEEIRRHGGEAVHFPVVETVLPDSFEELDRVLRDLERFGLVIVVSAAAARSVASRMATLGVRLPDATLICSVGPITAQVLKESGLRADIEPESEYTSEGLLESLKDIDVSGMHIAIFRGQEGREKLGEELGKSGAAVSLVMCYRRKMTDRSFATVIQAWESRGFDVVIITSHNILDALLQLLGARHHLLKESRVLVISDRIARYCQQLGISEVTVCSPGNASVIDGLHKIMSG